MEVAENVADECGIIGQVIDLPETSASSSQLWVGSFTDKEPERVFALTMAERLNVDGVFAARVKCKGFANSPDMATSLTNGRFYVIDARSGKVISEEFTGTVEEFTLSMRLAVSRFLLTHMPESVKSKSGVEWEVAQSACNAESQLRIQMSGTSALFVMTTEKDRIRLCLTYKGFQM